MHKNIYLLFPLLWSVFQLDAQGICDSVISINAIQPQCAGTGEAYLSASHPGGVFSGPGVIYGNGYLNTENLGAGFYTVKYTISGPGGCTVSASRDYEVLDAEEIFGWASGGIDCSNLASSVMLQGFLPNSGNYTGLFWEGPPGSGFSDFGNVVQANSAGAYKIKAFPLPPGQCPAFGKIDVPFSNNTVVPSLVSCTNCDEWNGFPPLRLKVTPVVAGWHSTLMSPDGAYMDNLESCTAIPNTFPAGNWKIELYNNQNGCRSSKTVYLNPKYARPSVSAGSDVQLNCDGTNGLLAATAPQNSGNGYNYFWSRPDGSTSTSSGWGAILAVNAPGAYVLHGVNQFTGCEDTDTALVSPTPLLIQSQFKVICDGKSYLGHSLPGKYTDTITLSSGCKSVQYTNLIVLAPIETEVTVTADHGQADGSILLNVTQGWPPFTYFWSNGANTASIFNLSAGTYTVTITDANNCERVQEIVVPLNKPGRSKSRDEGSSLALNSRIFPNPVAEGDVDVTVSFQSNKTAEALIWFMDPLGRRMAEHRVALKEGPLQFSFRENLPSGLYSIVLKTACGWDELGKLWVK